MPTERRRLILASASRARREILARAMIEHEAVVSGVDEEAVREALALENGELDGDDVAEVLARAKAETVSVREPGAVVIGADQVLSCEGRLYSKAETIAEAQAQLLSLRGKTHRLHAALAIAQDGEVTWSQVVTADIQMRAFTAAEVGQYLGRFADRAMACVGGYELDGPGVRLIEAVDGDYFTVLGLPLLQLMPQLRALGVIDP